MFGKTKQGKQRYQCLNCKKTFVWKRPYNKKYKEQHWFKLWIEEGYSTKQLVKQSKHSARKINYIRDYWLSKEPTALCNNVFKNIKYLIFDGTYFHKDGCLAVLINTETKKPIYYEYIKRENYEYVLPIMKHFKSIGLDPKAITIDGHQKVIRAIIETWPKVIIQRCLFHIQNQGLMWLRSNPKTEAGKTLRKIYSSIASLKNIKEINQFKKNYEYWYKIYGNEINKLSLNPSILKDLKRAKALIKNAMLNMFHFVKDQKIASITNLLEGYFSKLKHKYRCHNGLSKEHRISYLKWYCYFQNLKK